MKPFRLCYLFILFIIGSGISSRAQTREAARPPIWGIAKMTYRISSEALAQAYYGDFLGFSQAFSYPSDNGTLYSYKVNERQFLEFAVDQEAASKPRLISVSFETENCEQMRLYLLAQQVTVPSALQTDGAGNKVFRIQDPSGVPIEFIEFSPNSLHKKSKGKYLSPNRISTRIHHAGLYTRTLQDEPEFYTRILGCKRILRLPEDRNEKPLILYFQLPDCAEMIEHYPSDDVNFSHPCFVAADMQEVIYTLKERKKQEKLAAPMVGKGKRWLLNLTNADGTKVEFTEAFLTTL